MAVLGSKSKKKDQKKPQKGFDSSVEEGDDDEFGGFDPNKDDLDYEIQEFGNNASALNANDLSKYNF